ncbi:efflux RND transporter periplasmic adaptor subunit [Desulforegula conservatrix]|uniref:efflux RND transporter periplasmic adaptor subunit n=1 Tax=Desulforegula conservatrix TaxID=153026 RepID=UPI000427D151|nr:efflux RND transporter periplasmic adaptor subunit [Desulforegula conservatrix]
MKKNNNYGKNFALSLAFAALVAFSGGCSGDIKPGTVESKGNEDLKFTNTAKAEKTEVTDWYEAVGTVRPRTESRIEALVTANVKSVEVSAGAKVKKDQVLAEIDDRQLVAKLDQAKQALAGARSAEKGATQAVASAQAAFTQADSEYKRVQKYFSSQAATARELEEAKSRYLQAEAGLQQAKEALSGARSGIRQVEEVVKEAEIGLGYTKIKAPADGEILNRMVEPGDLASPGKPLFMMKTSGLMRLEAFVREGLINSVKPGQLLKVSMPNLKNEIDATLEEIVPYADPKSRSFLVKASISKDEGIYPGMFGKLLIPLEKHEAVVLPAESIQKIGQLELVMVQKEKGWERRYVKTGSFSDGKTEILSGLTGDEIIGYNAVKK